MRSAMHNRHPTPTGDKHMNTLLTVLGFVTLAINVANAMIGGAL